MDPYDGISQLIRNASMSQRGSRAPLRPPGFMEKIALEKSDLHALNRGRAPLLSSAEVAGWLGVSPRTVCFWAELGEMPGFKLGRQWRFSEAEVRKWLGLAHVSKRGTQVASAPSRSVRSSRGSWSG